MPKLLQPDHAVADLETGCSRLWFPRDSLAPNGLYQMVGGICWPILVQDVFKGCALLIGRDIRTGCIYVFEQRMFSSIDHVIGSNGQIASAGLSPWFSECWTRYYAYRYYWFQIDDYNRTYRRRIVESQVIEPKPVLIETHWGDDAHATLIIADQLEQQKLKIKGDTPVTQDLAQQQADPKQGPFPAVHALACALSGLSKRRIPDIGNAV